MQLRWQWNQQLEAEIMPIHLYTLCAPKKQTTQIKNSHETITKISSTLLCSKVNATDLTCCKNWDCIAEMHISTISLKTIIYQHCLSWKDISHTRLFSWKTIYLHLSAEALNQSNWSFKHQPWTTTNTQSLYHHWVGISAPPFLSWDSTSDFYGILSGRETLSLFYTGQVFHLHLIPEQIATIRGQKGTSLFNYWLRQ